VDDSLSSRLTGAGIDPASISDPQAAFIALVEAEDVPAVLDDRLAIEALSLNTTTDALPETARRRAVEDFFGLRWRGFEIVGESRNDPVITVVDFDPAWPPLFREWERRLAESLLGVAVRIEHIGSTAVPGLAAKPIIDIQVSVTDLEREERYVPGFEEIGVALRSRDAEHRYFRPAPGRPRSVQIHVCTVGGDWERDHLRFRDILRSDAATRDSYAELKRQLARRFPHDRLAYTEGKSEFIMNVLGRSQR